MLTEITVAQAVRVMTAWALPTMVPAVASVPRSADDVPDSARVADVIMAPNIEMANIATETVVAEIVEMEKLDPAVTVALNSDTVKDLAVARVVPHLLAVDLVAVSVAASVMAR
jgi:hypothetical protein